MLSEQMVAVLALLDGAGAGGLSTELLPAAAAAAVALGVDGVSAGVGVGPQGAVVAWGREAVAVALDDLQFTIGQGPGLEAAAAGEPVLVSDLREQVSRWPGFVSGALELEVRAVFAFPLRIGAISVGVLTAHRAVSGPLVERQLVDALALAEAVGLLLLNWAPADTGDGGPREDGPREDGPRPGWAQPVTHRAEVHQATGMISVQLDVSLAEALVRLRAHAYAQERPIAEVAADVVARRLRFQEPNP